MDQIDQLIDRVPNLPPSPTVATELLGLFKDPDRDIDRVVHLIGHDPSLTAEVLKRCNSAAFGGGGRPSDVFEAVTKLGFYEVYCLVVSVVGSRAMAMGRNAAGLDVSKLWKHSVITAVAAAAVAEHCDQEEPVAFTTGLLHDVGKLIYAAGEPEKYGPAIRASQMTGKSLAECEMAVFGRTHAAVGARLLSRWVLPPAIIVSVLNHHGNPAAAGPFEKLAACVHLGNLLAHTKVGEPPPEAELPLRAAGALKSLQLRPDALPRIVATIDKGMKRAESLLQLAV